MSQSPQTGPFISTADEVEDSEFADGRNPLKRVRSYPQKTHQGREAGGSSQSPQTGPFISTVIFLLKKQAYRSVAIPSNGSVHIHEGLKALVERAKEVAIPSNGSVHIHAFACP